MLGRVLLLVFALVLSIVASPVPVSEARDSSITTLVKDALKIVRDPLSHPVEPVLSLRDAEAQDDTVEKRDDEDVATKDKRTRPVRFGGSGSKNKRTRPVRFGGSGSKSKRTRPVRFGGSGNKSKRTRPVRFGGSGN
ncbi:hypothetical protein BU24DRAFT_280266 [Aaosphaeria arxii CBS 175.79]|uniref:Uncharacterized protein n=1 Tax=Aaosphaeria arxii CBS 175.79 TaxID=1450172 RepID=A0A6A5XE17_9PLEO|nr:uncharacterized protein BU24DRAFT_280266 [Aaosphaeria arxii CBS 175.79]KAF2011395.1 hypothetical protein BU24DRAFT_280266 [Aaosphaeria arxii CBS 175.79]